MKCLWLVRHAESRGNTGEESDMDPPLTPTGEEQARTLQRSLGGIRFDRIYLSPLKRTRRTFELSALSADHVVFDSRLLEWRPLEAYQELLPYEALPDYALGDDHDAWVTDFAERIGSFAEEVRALRFRHVLAVTHGGTACSICNALVGRRPGEQPRPAGMRPMHNTGIGQLCLSEDGAACSVGMWNHSGHLGHLGEVLQMPLHRI